MRGIIFEEAEDFNSGVLLFSKNAIPDQVALDKVIWYLHGLTVPNEMRGNVALPAQAEGSRYS